MTGLAPHKVFPAAIDALNKILSTSKEYWDPRVYALIEKRYPQLINSMKKLAPYLNNAEEFYKLTGRELDIKARNLINFALSGGNKGKSVIPYQQY